MTYIVPNSKVYILKGIPITNNYKDTLYFANRTAQYNYFFGQSTAALRFTELSYIRVNASQLKLEARADQLYNANYLMFQNTSFGDKWFYAFITKVEYINNETTLITFEIDRIQTWWFDVTLKPCMVARQHAVNDGVYVNCEPENFADFAYFTSYEHNLMSDENLSIKYITYTTGHYPNNDYHDTNTWTPASQGIANNVYSTLEIKMWENTTAGITAMKNYLDAIILGGHEDDIIAVFLGPKNVSTFIPENVGESTVSIPKANLRQNAFQGYVPRNNKIYNYPFCKLILEKGGSTQEYAIEDFRDGITDAQVDNVQFGYVAIVCPAPQIMAYPKNYRGTGKDYNDGMDIAEFPQAPIKGDTYQMWCVQNGGGYAINLLGALANMGLSAGRGDMVGGFIDLRQMVQQAANGMAQAYNAAQLPDNVSGLGRPNILSNLGANTFWLKVKTLSYWQARQIDTYFDMFGYQENHVFVPNIHARQKWTYVQTVGCTITGNAPAEDIAFIEQKFDSGITWWVNASEVGNYNLTNPTL